MQGLDTTGAVARLVNNAARETQAGRYAAARHWLSSALTANRNLLCLARHSAADRMSSDNRPDKTTDLGSLPEMLHFACSTSGQCGESSVLSSHQSTPFCEDGCFLFQHPLNIDLRSRKQTGCPNSFEISLLTFVSIYNLALNEHLHAIAVKTDPKLLQRAVNLYRRAAEALVVNGPNEINHIKIAILSNTGHAYYCLQCPSQVRSCFQELALAIVTFRAANDAQNDTKQHLHPGFLSNTMLLFVNWNTAAAA